MFYLIDQCMLVESIIHKMNILPKDISIKILDMEDQILVEEPIYLILTIQIKVQ